jgi:Domain of unknown function (DUF5710)
MQRTYLFVPPEEKAEVQSLGAEWDAASKRWYINSNQMPEKFSRWLPSTDDEDEQDQEFTITSSEPFVAVATAPCQQCRAEIEVICIHCASGTVSGDSLDRFTVTDIWAMDENLTQQLEPWPTFRRTREPDGTLGHFANHCPHCRTAQEDLYLHSEPDAPFFDIPSAPAGEIKLIPLSGTVRLSGDEQFAVE